MKFWQSVSFNDPLELLELARGAEAAGFEGVLLSEHLCIPAEFAARYPYSESGEPGFEASTPFPDPWVTLSAMAAVTRKLRFATMIYILPLHHPLEVAKSVGTASLLSGGRVALGAGAGWMREEFELLGVDFATRGSRFDESIDVLRKLWRGGLVEHHGRHFDFAPLQMSPAPTAPIPIYIGGASTPALRRAARLGDGWLGAGNSPDEACEILAELGRLRAAAGRSERPFDAIVPLVTPPDAASLERLAALGATGTVSYPFVYSLGPEATLEQKLSAMQRYGEDVIRPLAGL